MNHRLFSILVAVYNEKAHINACVNSIIKAELPDGFSKEIILVDDGSTDGTKEIISRLSEQHPNIVRVFFHKKNMGKGAALQTAIKQAQGNYIIFQDADLEYDPNEYPMLLKPILERGADVVYGSRFMMREMSRVLNYHHALGNKFLTHLSNLLTGLNVTDMETCYKVFRADILKTIPIRSNRFGIEPEITAKIAKRKCVIYEVPISYYGRTYSEGKKINWKDGLSAIGTIFKYWLIDDCFEACYGNTILTEMGYPRRFNEGLVRLLKPFMGEAVLDIGSGIGNVSRLFPMKGKITVSDNNTQYVETLENAFLDSDIVDVKKIDISNDSATIGFGKDAYDTVTCLNVLEHIEDDKSAIMRMRFFLVAGGRLIIVVPQYECLYGSYDSIVGHCRRYDAKRLKALLSECGFDVEYARAFNSISILGWWLNSVLLRRKKIGKLQLKIFDVLAPFLFALESRVRLPGLSLLIVGRKTS